MRRTFLIGGTAALLTLAFSRPSHAENLRRIALRHSGTGATFDGIWFSGDGPDLEAMSDLSSALADEGCDPPKPFDPATIAIVWEVASRTRLGSVLEVHSGYRTPRVNRMVHGAGDSQHLRAMAMDIGVPSGRMPVVAETARKLARGGVGIYRHRHFVHLDSGPVRSWSDGGSRGGSDFRDDRLTRIAEAWRLGGR
jgi:uncharacterized protein YcbK (DUF882 family)